MVTTPGEINSCLRDFYKDLYSSKIDVTEAECLKFFANLEIPRLDCDSRDDLDAPISELDIFKAIHAFPAGKTALSQQDNSFHDKND